MSDDLLKRLREFADVAEAGDKPHWAQAMRDACAALSTPEPSREPTQEQVVEWINVGFKHAETVWGRCLYNDQFCATGYHRSHTLAHAAGYEAGRMAGGKENGNDATTAL
jgi:hypothetical protein